MIIQEAAIRRERSLAYAFSHQWKASSRATTPTFRDPSNPQWGWSWLERWMAARPWEGQATATNNEATDNDSVKSVAKKAVPREAMSYQAAPSTPAKTSRPPSRRSPSTPPAKSPLFVGKIKPASPRGSRAPSEDDLRSIASLHSERPRRHSLAAELLVDYVFQFRLIWSYSQLDYEVDIAAGGWHSTALTDEGEGAPLAAVANKPLRAPGIPRPPLLPQSSLSSCY